MTPIESGSFTFEFCLPLEDVQFSGRDKSKFMHEAFDTLRHPKGVVQGQVVTDSGELE